MRTPLLLVVCVILGLLLNVTPTSMPGLAPSVRVVFGEATPTNPLPDDADEDDTLDDADDLVCSIRRTRGAFVRPADRPIHTAVPVQSGGAWMRSRHVVPPHGIDRPIVLCRLTC
jgi:hypothetical protein